MSSASIPFMFAAAEIDGMQLTDGGNFQNLAVGDPINRCLEEEGVSEDDIIVDVILCLQLSSKVPKWTMEDTSWLNAGQIYRRRKQISEFYENYEDFLRVSRAYPDITYRYIVAPSRAPPISGFLPIDADEELIQKEIDFGYEDGLAAI